MKKQTLAKAATEKTAPYESTLDLTGPTVQNAEEARAGIRGRVQNQLRNMTDYFHEASRPRLKYAGRRPIVNLEKRAKREGKR
jgi:hypothetical protein